MRKITVLLCLLIAFFYIFRSTYPVYAQSLDPQSLISALGIATYIPIKDEKVKDGDVIAFSPEGYILSNKEYDQNVIGVVSLNPAVYLQIDEEGQKSYPVVGNGNVKINVSSANGEIKPGDLLTTSSIPGVAVKATRSGFVLGNALDGYNSSDPAAVDQIVVNLNVHYFYSTKRALSQALTDILNLSALAATEQPSAIFKYIVAAVVLLLSIAFGFFTFARVAKNGVEALGRNPLAGRLIQLGIFFNVFITVCIVLVGAVIAFFIIRL